jgi:hypothetical protein
MSEYNPNVLYHVMRIDANGDTFTKIGDIHTTGINDLKAHLIDTKGEGVYLVKEKNKENGIAFKLEESTGFTSSPANLLP